MEKMNSEKDQYFRKIEAFVDWTKFMKWNGSFECPKIISFIIFQNLSYKYSPSLSQVLQSRVGVMCAPLPSFCPQGYKIAKVYFKKWLNLIKDAEVDYV